MPPAQRHPSTVTVTAALEQGLALLQSGQPLDAEAVCRRVVAQAPTNADGHHLYGLAALATKQTGKACQRLTRAVALVPEAARFLTNLGTAQKGEGLAEQAERSYRHALRLMPDQAETRFNLANLRSQSERMEPAELGYRQALALQPDRLKYWHRLGDLFLGLRRDAEALQAYGKADRLAGGHAVDAAVNQGMAFQRLNRLPQAFECYERALAARPDLPSAHWNRALALLVCGRLLEGWEEYEWRWRLPDCQPRPFAQPQWLGGPFVGQRLLVHAEQGLGDTLHMARYLTKVVALGGEVILECQPLLHRLLSGNFPQLDVVAAGSPLPAFDLHLPLLSLPRLFQTGLDSVPAEVPYLRAPDAWALPPRRPGTAAVGLVWGGDPNHRNDRQRSLDPSSLAKLLAIPDVTFYSLQKGARAADLAGLPAADAVVDLGSRINDFADTAAVLRSLDLVVTVDTSVAHLAGALGCPVCILLPYAPDWRWLLERADSPWYPSARLFRQAAPGEWSGVIQALATHLATLDPAQAAGSGSHSS